MIAAYIEPFRAAALVELQYRAAALAGVATQFAFGWIRMEIFVAVLTKAAAPALSLRQTTDYIWLGQAFLMLLFTWRVPALREAVRSGALGIELLRPVDCYGFWYAQSLARVLVPCALRALPMLAICLATGLLHPPVSIEAGLWTAISLAMAFLLSTALAMMVSTAALWLVAGDGMAALVPGFLWSLSGVIVPLAFLPDWLRTVAEALPFAGLIDTPLRLYIGAITPDQAAGPLLRQALWTVALIALGWAAVQRGLRQAEIAGG